MDAGQRTKERAIFTKEEADYYNSLSIEQIVAEKIAKCGHKDLLGYFAGTVCMACAKEGHKQATGGKA